MIVAPLVMPEVITGLSLLLLFIAMEQIIGWSAGCGITTETIAHMTLTMAYTPSSCARGSPAWMSRSRRLPWTLGARPARVFFVITLPHHRTGISVGLSAGLHPASES